MFRCLESKDLESSLVPVSSGDFSLDTPTPPTATMFSLSQDKEVGLIDL